MIKVSNWIVVWTNGFYTHDFEDHWRVFEDLKEAEEFYKEKRNAENTYSASLTLVLNSTDYNDNGELENNDE